MSIKKISELANTSPSTVSRVLNDPEHICHDPELAKRIWEIAGKLNYLPNSAARELRKGKTKQATSLTIDIFLTRFDSLDKDPFFYELFQFLQGALQKNRCLLGNILSTADIMKLESDSTPGIVPYKTMEHLLHEKTNHCPAFIPRKKNTGLIILGKCSPELVPALKKRYAYLVGIDRNPSNYSYDEVICSGEAAAKMAVEWLIALGHKKIAYIGDCTYESRYVGYYQTLLTHHIPFDYRYVHPSTQTEEEGNRIMNDILKEEDPPTAIFCANDCTALGVLRSLKKGRKKNYFPSVIAIDNIRKSAKTSPMLTTIDIPKQELAHFALLLLLDQQKKAHKECVRIELPCRLIERDSCTYAPS